MNLRYMSHFKVTLMLVNDLIIMSISQEYFFVATFEIIVFLCIFFLCRIVLELLMEHLLVYYKKIKYHLLTEKVYRRKM